MAVSKPKAASSSKKAAVKKAPVAKKPAPKKKASAVRVAAVKKPVAKSAKVAKKAPATKPVASKVAPKKKAPPAPVKKAVAKKVSPTKPLESVNLKSSSSPSTFQETAQRETVLLHSYEPTVDEGADPGHFPTDEVLDETDQAQHLQLQEQAAISIRARELNKPEFHPEFDGVHCVDCDDDIPKERLSLRKVRCVHCQTFLEEAKQRQRRLVG